MLLSTQLQKPPTVDRLVKIWTERYIPNIATSTRSGEVSAYTLYKKFGSPEGRARTLKKLHDSLVEIDVSLPVFDREASTKLHPIF